MAHMASPVPFSMNRYGESTDLVSRRPRPLPRSLSFKNASPNRLGASVNSLSRSQTVHVGDSSDDDLPVEPIKFSAATNALLNGEISVDNHHNNNVSPLVDRYGEGVARLALNRSPILRSRGPVRHEVEEERQEQSISPSTGLSKRIVRLSLGGSTPGSGLRTAAISTEGVSGKKLYSETPAAVTPAPRYRIARDGSASPVDEYADLHAGESQENHEAYDSVRPFASYNSSGGHRFGQSRREDPAPSMHPSSIRVKRLGKVTGSFLSGPARRGRRRQSDEQESPVPEGNLGLDLKRSPTIEEEHARSPPLDADDKAPHVRFTSGSPMMKTIDTQPVSLSANSPPALTRSTSINSSSHSVRTTALIPREIPVSIAADEQENLPPVEIKSSVAKISAIDYAIKDVLVSKPKALPSTPGPEPSRKALVPKSNNTPHRPAPPPPKMTVLETATARAGATAASHSRKKRNTIAINGTVFTRLDRIGQGGSSRVYKVMAENYKIFALKKVTLEGVDELAIRGFKGEIDLLKKLENVERVVRLYDWEINEEKQTLSVLMEIGEVDLSRLMRPKPDVESSRVDLTTTRYHWKEMLECVAAVHEYDVVHSDLKPANFLLIQGRLKLIDFGIANAIQDDTVNVHREHQVGTPNYMSPEAIVGQTNPGAANGARIMKLGKPSDVWSLGCILYQMVYGKPPFGHFTQHFQRVMAIANPDHVIDFPAKGQGDVLVPPGLLKTLKGCLQRDPKMRPTVHELLRDTDPFLYPDAAAAAALETQNNEDSVEVSRERLGRIIASVVNHCEKVGIPSDGELMTWESGFFAKLQRIALEEHQQQQQLLDSQR